MNIIDIDKIHELLASDITSYRIAKDTNLSPQLIDQYRTLGAKVENMQIRIAKKLSDYMKEQDK